MGNRNAYGIRIPSYAKDAAPIRSGSGGGSGGRGGGGPVFFEESEVTTKRSRRMVVKTIKEHPSIDRAIGSKYEVEEMEGDALIAFGLVTFWEWTK